MRVYNSRNYLNTGCEQHNVLVDFFLSNRLINRRFYMTDNKIIEGDFHHETCHFHFLLNHGMHHLPVIKYRQW
jgi:hypothetical protein